MKYKLIYTTKFKKDYKLAVKRGLPITKLKDTITLLQTGQQLPASMQDHALTGDYAGFRCNYFDSYTHWNSFRFIRIT